MIVHRVPGELGTLGIEIVLFILKSYCWGSSGQATLHVRNAPPKPVEPRGRALSSPRAHVGPRELIPVQPTTENTNYYRNICLQQIMETCLLLKPSLTAAFSFNFSIMTTTNNLL